MNYPETLWQDVRIALRTLRRSPATTALSILSVALGLGLTTALFSVVDGILLRPFPIPQADRVVRASSVGEDGRYLGYGWPDYEDMSRSLAGTAEVAAYERKGSIIKTGDETKFILAYAVSPNFFDFLGVRPLLGAASLAPVEGRPSVVIGHRLWRSRLGGDPDIVGKTVMLSSKAFRVAGVMPADFTGLARLVVNDAYFSVDDWFNVLGRGNERTERDGHCDFELVARLKPGVSDTAAADAMDAAIRGPGKYKPAPKGVRGTLLDRPFAPGWKATLIGGGGLLLTLGLVLFAACANVAQLRLAQADARRKEIGIRMALGAGSGRMVGQLLVETALFGVVGAALGILFAQGLIETTTGFLSARYSYIDPGIRLDWRALTFALTASVAAILLTGLAPARHAVRLNVMEFLKSEQGAAGGRRSWQVRGLIATQMGVSVVLFGLAVLFLQSFRNAANVWPGLDPTKRLLVVEASPSFGPAERWCREVCERLVTLPGVRGATFARRLPLSGSGGGMTVRVELPGQAPLGVGLNNVAPNYFRLMGTRVLAGRGIDVGDRKGGPLVVVISRTLARMAFGSRNPLGEWMRVEGAMRQVVGVAEDAPSNDLHEAFEPFVYLPYAQMPSGDFTVLVETAGEPQALEQAVRVELKRFDPAIHAMSFTTLRRHLEQALTFDQLLATVSTSLGAVGFLLTAAGLFGVIQHAVNRRTREIGLRMSLGARPGQIHRLVIEESLRMSVWGVPFGLVALGGAAWCVRTVVFGVTPLDPLAYVASAVAAAAVGVAASWLPAWRASRVDPMAALRSE
ncbi:MAG: ABC transporter permease [Acidobacteria bacterium]|nr:ABC transporter permease [Acidobacteriota bacterium]